MGYCLWPFGKNKMFERTCFRRKEKADNLPIINKNTSHSMVHTISIAGIR